MRVLRAQVSVVVRFELQSIEHDGLRRIGIRLVGWHDCGAEYDALAIRRPLERADLTREVRELLRLAAGTIQEPYLIAGRTARTISEERDGLAVRAPARAVLAERRAGELDVVLAVPAHEPQVLVAL